MSPRTTTMPDAAPAKEETSATIPYKKMKTTEIGSVGGFNTTIKHISHLPCGQQILIYSRLNSFRVWDLEKGTQVGEEWEDKEQGVVAIALSPDSKTVATGSFDGAVRLWNVDAGKVIKKWTGHTAEVNSVCWSPDGGRVASGSILDETFRVWDVESGTTILGPIKAGQLMTLTVCYSPDAKMIATGGDCLKVWDANKDELLITVREFTECLVLWTSDGKTLIATQDHFIRKFDTATWSETAVLNLNGPVMVDSILDCHWIDSISLSPNERILASTSTRNTTVQLWDLETSQPIEPLLQHENPVTCVAWSADGMFLLTASSGLHVPIYKWDLSAILKDISLNNVDATRRPAIKIEAAPPRQIPLVLFGEEGRADPEWWSIRGEIID